MDERTDIWHIETKKSLAIVVRYFKVDSRVVNRFLKLIEVEDGTGQVIFDSMMIIILKAMVFRLKI